MAAAQVEGEAVLAWNSWVTTKIWMSRRIKRVETVSVPPAQYLPGRRRKKKAMQARSEFDFSLGKPLWEIESMQWGMDTGIGRTLPGGGSSFLYKVLSQEKIDCAHGVESWVWGPVAAKICPMEGMYCSTLRLWIGLWLAVRTPVQTL